MPSDRDPIIAPWDSPAQRAASWKQWAMQQSIILCAANVIPDAELEKTADRIYRWTAFPSERRSGDGK